MFDFFPTINNKIKLKHVFLVSLFLGARSGVHRNSDRSNKQDLHCTGDYPQTAANSILAGHLLRKIIEKVRLTL